MSTFIESRNRGSPEVQDVLKEPCWWRHPIKWASFQLRMAGEGCKIWKYTAKDRGVFVFSSILTNLKWIFGGLLYPFIKSAWLCVVVPMLTKVWLVVKAAVVSIFAAYSL